MQTNMVSVDYRQIRNAGDIEDVLCLSTLITGELLPYDATLENSRDYYNKLSGGCFDCPLVDRCLACIINE